MIKKVLILFFLHVSIVMAEKEINLSDFKYIVQLNTGAAICKVLVNNMSIVNNYPLSSGTGSTGATVSAFVENGENTLGIYVASIDSRRNIEEFQKGAYCDATLSINSPDRKIEITNIRATPDDVTD